MFSRVPTGYPLSDRYVQPGLSPCGPIMVETACLSPDTIRGKMLRRLLMGGACIAIIFTSLVADALTLTAVQSRKAHGTASVDLPIDTAQSIGGAVTVESRDRKSVV